MAPARRVGIVDYHVGNIQSIGNALEHLGVPVLLVKQPADVETCSHLILPGVGAFGFCAERLEQSGMTPVIRSWALEQQRPLLGICVGMQLLGDGSEESPDARGLGWIGGWVRRIPAAAPEVRVPHVGWNAVTFSEAWGGFRAGEQADFYFDHSFAFTDPPTDATIGVCEHGVRFTAVVRRGSIVAAQFHPEKSQAAGMRVLRGFLAS